MYHSEWYHFSFLKLIVLVPPLLSITSGSSWLYVEWNAQPATFRVLYRESGAPDYQVIVPTTSQLSHNISALQPHTLYNIVVEATHTVTQQKVNSSVTRAYTTPHGELKGVYLHTLYNNVHNNFQMMLIKLNKSKYFYSLHKNSLYCIMCLVMLGMFQLHQCTLS